jgi:hypothetical protein
MRLSHELEDTRTSSGPRSPRASSGSGTMQYLWLGNCWAFAALLLQRWCKWSFTTHMRHFGAFGGVANGGSIFIGQGSFTGTTAASRKQGGRLKMASFLQTITHMKQRSGLCDVLK